MNHNSTPSELRRTLSTKGATIALLAEPYAVKLGVAPSPIVPATIQERAWSSPISYTPPVAKTAKK